MKRIFGTPRALAALLALSLLAGCGAQSGAGSCLDLIFRRKRQRKVFGLEAAASEQSVQNIVCHVKSNIRKKRFDCSPLNGTLIRISDPIVQTGSSAMVSEPGSSSFSVA